MNDKTLPDLEQHLTDGRLTANYDPDAWKDYDMAGFIQYVKEKYSGDSSDVTQEEKDRFIIKSDRRKTA